MRAALASPETGVRLAAADASRAPELAVIHGQAFDDGWDAAALAGLASHGGARLSAAETALGEAVGFILTWQAGGDAEILTVAVSPSRRRKGVGRALLDGAIAQCRADGAGRMFLEVAASNAAARALYRSLGFFETGRRKGYYHRAGSPAEDALVLGRTL